MLNLLSIVFFKKIQDKLAFLKIPAQMFKAGELKVFEVLRFFVVFEAHFLIKFFLIKKTCIKHNEKSYAKNYDIANKFRKKEKNTNVDDAA